MSTANEEEEFQLMISDCTDRSEKLSEWEQNFIDSMIRNGKTYSTSSPKQLEALESIWDKATKKG